MVDVRLFLSRSLMAYFSIAVTKHTTRQPIKESIWELMFQRIRDMNIMATGRPAWHWSRNLDPQAWGSERTGKWLHKSQSPQWHSSYHKVSPPDPYHTVHQLGSRHSNIRADGAHSHPNHHKPEDTSKFLVKKLYKNIYVLHSWYTVFSAQLVPMFLWGVPYDKLTGEAEFYMVLNCFCGPPGPLLCYCSSSLRHFWSTGEGNYIYCE